MSSGLTIDPLVAGWFEVERMEGDRYLSEVADRNVQVVRRIVGANRPVAMMGASVGGLVTICALGRVRLWMQNGMDGLDSLYSPFQRRADARLIARGYRPGRDFVSRVLRRGGHNEWSWTKRLPDAISWWLRGV